MGIESIDLKSEKYLTQKFFSQNSELAGMSMQLLKLEVSKISCCVAVDYGDHADILF